MEKLTKRELEVLDAIARGLTSKEIARHLFLSENTIETHRQNLFSKFRAHNVVELCMKAITQGYINPHEVVS